MINPQMLRLVIEKEKGMRLPGEKLYTPFLMKRMHYGFRRKAEAVTYGNRVRDRWIRLYDAAIATPTSPRPSPKGEGK